MTKPIKIHASQVEMIPLADLKRFEKNPMVHPEAQLAALERIILDSGFTTPLLIDKANVIIGGHGRALVAERIGMVEVPCVRVKGLSAAQVKALRISDNRLSDLSIFDPDLLRAELLDLKGLGLDLTLTGFDLLELDELFATPPVFGADPDDAPEAPKIPVSRAGDLWELGDHRLICGSSTDAPTVEEVLGGRKPHLMVTDPPYGVEYDANFRNGIRRADGSIVSARAIGKVSNDDRADWREAWGLFSGEVAYVWCASLHIHEVAESLLASGFELRASIIWGKNQIAIGRGHYHWQHEPCWYAVRKGCTGHWAGDRKQTTLWSIDKPHKSETGHSTQKPIDCMRKPIENNSQKGDWIYEPFCGSGTTIIAAQMTGRRCLAVELDPAYIDVAVLRWQTFVGQEATLLETGETFSQVTARRIAEREAAE